MASLKSTTRHLRFVLVVLLLGTLFAAVSTATVSAAPPIVVNTTMDALHGSDGSGCVTAGGACSLRDAVLHANIVPNTVITLPAGLYKLTIPPSGTDLATTGDLNLLADMTINGAGAGTTTIDGSVIADGIFRVFGATVSLTGLTLANGLRNSVPADGGALIVTDGAAANVTDCVFFHNMADGPSGSGDAEGGAIWTNGVLVVLRSVFTNNIAQGGIGDAGKTGGNANGGAIMVANSAFITAVMDSTFTGNTAKGGDGGSGDPGTPTGGVGGPGTGGAITISGGSSTITGSTFVNNGAVGGKGGIGAFEFVTGGTGGKGGDSHGGAVNVDPTVNTIDVGNSTFVSNTVTGGNGGNGGAGTPMGSGGAGGTSFGGAFEVSVANSTSITNATIDGNSAISGIGGMSGGNTHGNPGGRNGGGIMAFGSTQMTNTIVTNNGTGGNCAGSILNGGHNLQFNPNSGCGDTPFTVGDPKLTPLGNYGGPTQTRGIMPGSAALDAGDDTTCGSSPVAGVDQRGIRRPQGAHCDIGAYEYAIVTTPPPSRPGPVMSGSPNAVPTARPGTGGGSGIPNPIPMPRQ